MDQIDVVTRDRGSTLFSIHKFCRPSDTCEWTTSSRHGEGEENETSQAQGKNTTATHPSN